MMRTILVVLMVVGCGYAPLEVDQTKVVAPPARADEAIDVVMADWHMQFRPIVWWYGGDALDCPGGRSWKDDSGVCRLGLSRPTGRGGVIIVSAQDKDPANPTPIHFTALTHEMGHCASEERGEGGDMYHAGHFFNYPDGHEDLGNVDDGDAGLEEIRLAGLGM
jgi:hypothetical protein